MIANIMKSFLHGFLCIQYKSQVTAAEIIKDKKHRSHEIIIISEMYLKSLSIISEKYRPAKVMIPIV